MLASSIRLPTWYRGLAIVVGLVSIVLAFVVLAYPGLALATLVLLLAFALLVIGMDRLIAGVTGHPYGWISGAGATLRAEMAGPAGTPPQDAPSVPPSKP